MRQIKKTISYMTIFILLIQVTSCTMSETCSNPKKYNIIITGKFERIKMYLHKGAGTYSEILPIESIYSVDIPAMRGGYTSFLGIRFNKHIPENYKVIKISNEVKTINELSINEIEELKKDENGNYLLNL